LRLIGFAPISSRSDGNGPSSSRSVSSRSAGTAQISECTTAFTCAHQVAAAVFAPARSTTDGSSGTIRSRLA
jgi:hypothetical protein